MNRTLVGLVAAAGILGCAKDVPVYTQRDVVQEVPGGGFYREVWSNAEQLKLSFYGEEEDGTKGLEFSLTRYEPSDSTVCLKKEAYAKMYVDVDELAAQMQSYGRTLRSGLLPPHFIGWIEGILVDENCDGTVDSATETLNGESTTLTRADFGDQYDTQISGSEEALNTIFGNIPYQVKLWHERKGFEE